MPFATRLLAIAAEEITRAGIRFIAEATEDIEIIGEAPDLTKGLVLFRQLHPDVAIIGLRFPDKCALDAIPEFLDSNDQARIIVLADHSGDVEIAKALKLGADGFICRDATADELIAAIRTVNAGKRFIPDRVARTLSEYIGNDPLTPTEMNIIRMVVGGMSNKEIAFALEISENTVKTHLRNIFAKLGVSDRVTAVTTAIRRGLVRVNL